MVYFKHGTIKKGASETVKTLLKNGTVVSGDMSVREDVLIDGEKIVKVGRNLEAEDAQVVDVNGKLLFPGFIDGHTHFDLEVAGTVTADDFETGTRAAIAGGTTLVIDYASQDKGGHTLKEGLEKWHKKADGKCSCDYSFHMSIVEWNEKTEQEIQDMIDHGITSFKLYMTYPAMIVNDCDMYKILKKLGKCGCFAGVHCENAGVIDALIAEAKKEGRFGPENHPLVRPDTMEAEAVHRLLVIAKEADAPVMVVHLTNKKAFEEVMRARANGQEVYAETCPQYLEFTCDVYKREDGRNFVCSPPMKGQESQDALWKAIKNGMIDTVATDHCPFQSYEKDWGKDDFTKIPNGCPGVENLYPYMLDAANSGKITFERAVELCSTNVAKIFGCDNKGSISVGKDADIVIYDKDKDFTISVDNMHSDLDHTIWEGKQLHGYPIRTYLRGNVVYDNGDFVGTPGLGEYVKRSPRKH